MKKILALSILISMVLVAIPATIASDDCAWCATDADGNAVDDNNEYTGIITKAHVGGNGNGGSGGQGAILEHAPIIKCKWEYDQTVTLPPSKPWQPYCDDNTHDACPFLDGLQVQVQLAANAYVGYYAIITDPDGVGHVDHVYADIWHPNGQFKYQIELFPIGFDNYGNYDKSTAIDTWNHVKQWHSSLVTYSEFTTHDPSWTKDYDIGWELEEEDAYLYYVAAAISYCQPAGDYCVGVRAIDGLDYWSDYLFNQFWYIPTAAVHLDFTTVDYGTVVESEWKQCPGDKDIDTHSLPTVKNIGNTPVWFSVLQDDMQFGKTADNWNVEYKARLSKDGVYTPVYSPGVKTTIPGYLGMCTEEKFDFWIHVLKGYPGFDYSGLMTIYAHILYPDTNWISPQVFAPAPLGVLQNINDYEPEEDCPCIDDIG